MVIMAQPMMHLLIADKIYTQRSGSIHSYGDFLLGSIAPDAVHVKENYTREQKDIYTIDLTVKVLSTALILF